MPPANSPAHFLSAAGVLFALLILSSCVQGQRATDVGDPGFPFGPSAVTNQPLAYATDIRPILDADCSRCHSARDTQGNYSVANYAAVMNNQRTGDAKTPLVRTCAPGGSMYLYFSGDAVTKSTTIFRWMVYYNAAETR